MRRRKAVDQGPFDWEPEGSSILAEAHTDDYAIEVQFDATPYFAQASDDELIALAEIEFRGDFAADAVAQYMEAHDENLQAMFTYLRAPATREKKNAPGFEVIVDAKEALLWIREHRPHLLSHPSIGGWML